MSTLQLFWMSFSLLHLFWKGRSLSFEWTKLRGAARLNHICSTLSLGNRQRGGILRWKIYFCSTFLIYYWTTAGRRHVTRCLHKDDKTLSARHEKSWIQFKVYPCLMEVISATGVIMLFFFCLLCSVSPVLFASPSHQIKFRPWSEKFF